MLRIFCVMGKGAVRDSWHWETGRVDSGPAVRILDRLCGFFRRLCGFSAGRVDSEQCLWILDRSCGFSRTCADSSGGFSAVIGSESAVLALKGRFPAGSGPRVIRTTCQKSARHVEKSARSTENPQTLFRINTTREKSTHSIEKSARPPENPHGLSKIRTARQESARPPENPHSTLNPPNPLLNPAQVLGKRGLRSNSRHAFWPLALFSSQSCMAREGSACGGAAEALFASQATRIRKTSGSVRMVQLMAVAA